jgi:hypothetical protein
MSDPIIDMPLGAVYPAHRARVLTRIGHEDDPDGEHAWVEIVECEASPKAVGTKYRTPIAGGPPHRPKWDAERLAVARQAPHARDEIMKATPTPTPAEPEPMPRPMLYLTNAASVRAVKKGNAKPETAARVGPGDHWCIMSKPDPRRGELGQGTIFELCPLPGNLDDVKKSRMTLADYRRAFIDEPAPVSPREVSSVPRSWLNLSMGSLSAHTAFKRRREEPIALVQPGDTLTCSCSAKNAAKGQCHRVWAAALLIDAGWDVWLDGERFTAGDQPALMGRGGDGA